MRHVGVGPVSRTRAERIENTDAVDIGEAEARGSGLLGDNLDQRRRRVGDPRGNPVRLLGDAQDDFHGYHDQVELAVRHLVKVGMHFVRRFAELRRAVGCCRVGVRDRDQCDAVGAPVQRLIAVPLFRKCVMRA